MQRLWRYLDVEIGVKALVQRHLHFTCRLSHLLQRAEHREFSFNCAEFRFRAQFRAWLRGNRPQWQLVVDRLPVILPWEAWSMMVHPHQLVLRL